MSGNIRLETNFIKNHASPIADRVFSSATPVRASELNNSALGAASSNIAKETENRSSIGRLDELINDFQKPLSSEHVNEF